ERYAGVTADFLRWLLAEGRIEVFKKRFGELQKRFNDDVTGQQNDIRIVTNLAQLGAAFEQFAEYLGDVWEGWKEASRKFVEEGLVAIRDGMLGEAKAAIVELNKQGGLSHGKVTRCLESLFGIRLSRGGSVHTVLRAATRCEPVYESIRQTVA